ncbi:AAA family ATPase [Candidatus Poribacteria bacterium]
MAVITISRQLGSAGDYIAGLVASAMSYRLVNKQSLVMEAQRRGEIASEIADEIGEGKPSLLGRFDRNRSQAVYAMRSILRDMASEGSVVIVGRGGHIELKDRTDLLRVSIIADLEIRVSRIEREDGVGRPQAIKMLKKSDKERCEYTKHFFLADCSDPEFYDMTINTSRILPEAAARLIQQAARQFRTVKPSL